MKRLLINILIFFVALILLFTIGLIGLFYTIWYSIIKFRKVNFINYWGDLFYSINVAIDKIGNILLAQFLNNFAIKNKDTLKFGRVRHTISYVLAVNLMDDNLTSFGDLIVNILEFLDPGHMEKTLEDYSQGG